MKYACFAIVPFLILQCSVFAASAWKVQTGPGNDILNDVQFIDQSTGIAVGGNRTILKTENYGKTWTRKINIDVTTDMQAVHFPSANVGYAVGMFPGGGGAAAYKTVDGGDSWSAIAVPALSELRDVFFFSDNVGWISGYSVASRVYQTTDGGTTWTPATGGLPFATFYSIQFVDALTGWTVGSFGDIYNTIDGGSNWTQQGLGVTANNLFSVFFIDQNNGWAAGVSGAILKTTNGGANWSLATTPVNNSFTKVHFINTLQGWAVGDSSTIILSTSANGTIVKTTDGGSTWTSEEAGSPIDLKGVYFTDQNNGWVVGGEGSMEVILKYVVDPTVTSVTRYHPLYGPVSWEGQGALNRLITVEGSGFKNGAQISFTGGVTNSATAYVSQNKLNSYIYVPPSEPVGYKNVTVTNPDTGSFTLSNAFKIETDSHGPSFISVTLTNTVDASSQVKITNFPQVTAVIEDPTGLAADSVRFSIYIPQPPGSSTPPEYFHLFPSTTAGYFTPIEQVGSRVTKATVTGYLTKVRDFATGNIEVPLNGVLTTGSPKALYIYAEDQESNPGYVLYNSAVYCDFTPLPPAPSALTSTVATPGNNTVTVQFESDKDLSGQIIKVLIAGPAGLASNHDVPAREVSGSMARSMAAATGRHIYNVTLQMTDFLGEILPIGIYPCMLRYGNETIAKTKIVLAPAKSP